LAQATLFTAASATLSGGPPLVSVIIPAHNASETIAVTLESLRAQTEQRWEAIVVDDGSTDATPELVAQVAAGDGRVRLLRQAWGGVSAARNAGMAQAGAGWLLFLDADDWLAPRHLERLSALLAADPALDVAHGGWVRAAPDGRLSDDYFGLLAADHFPALAGSCTLATLGVALIRRGVVEEVGGFDQSYRHCADWDLWLRLARAGARFGAVRERLAFYRLRPASLSLTAENTERLLKDVLRVVTLAHSPDPRVPAPLLAYREGAPRQQLPGRRLAIASWVAGLAIGNGLDARPLLGALAGNQDPDLDPAAIAMLLFEAVPAPRGRLVADWPALWPEVEHLLGAYLEALEAQAGAPGLTERARAALELMVIERARGEQPQLIGSSYVVAVELTRPIEALPIPAGARLLCCELLVEGRRRGRVNIPAESHIVSAHAIIDAVAVELGWQLLGDYFARTLYPTLRAEDGPDGVRLWRGELLLADNLPAEVALCPSAAHDQVGWGLLLQELWGRPAAPAARFYEAIRPDAYGGPALLADGSLTVEISDATPFVRSGAEQLQVTLTVGGEAVATAQVPVQEGLVSPDELIAALTAEAGLKLCYAAVRRGLIGRPLLAEPQGLRERLSAAARAAVPAERATR
jgi:GT2 family glycosyltransferase